MLMKRDSSGVTQGALVVVYGMIIGSLLTLVFQRYGALMEARTARYYMHLRAKMGVATITMDNGQ